MQEVHINLDGSPDLLFVFRHWNDGKLNFRTRLLDISNLPDINWSTSISTVFNDGDGIHDFEAQMLDIDNDGDDDVVFPFRHWNTDAFTLRTKICDAPGDYRTITHQFLCQP